MLVALTTGHKIGLIAMAATFIVFALSSSLLIPRYWPGFPGRRLPLFVFLTIALFGGMLTAVIVFGAEPKEAAAGGSTSSESQTQTTSSSTSQQAAGTSVTVKESEFKIELPNGETSLKAGSYKFVADNVGKIDHDLVISGPSVNDKTPVFPPGQEQTLQVTLKPGTYDFYCSVPGHKQAGMNLNVKVT